VLTGLYKSVRVLPGFPRYTLDHHSSPSKPHQVSESVRRTLRSHASSVIQCVRSGGNQWRKARAERPRRWPHVHEDIPRRALHYQSSHLPSYRLPTGGNSGRRLGNSEFVRMVVWSAGICPSDIGRVDVAGKTVEGGNGKDGCESVGRSTQQHRIITVVYGLM
jgi:hypothetical protein